MRLFCALIVTTFALGGVARAQTGAAADNGYVEAVGQSSFGSVTSQSFGVEAGVTILPHLQVFVEAGRTNDVSPSALGAAAQRIAGALTAANSNVAFTVKEPATFFDGGLRYVLVAPGESRVQPYILGGVGIARLEKNVRFSVGGTDVTDTLSQAPYYVTLGSDLSGSSTSLMLVGGGGVAVPAWTHVVFDFQIRVGRILADEEAITVGRAGIGVGVRF